MMQYNAPCDSKANVFVFKRTMCLHSPCAFIADMYLLPCAYVTSVANLLLWYLGFCGLSGMHAK